MGPIHVRARYDGHVLVLEEPADLPQGVVLELWASPAEKRTGPQLGTAVGRVRLADDSQATPEDFEEYL